MPSDCIFCRIMAGDVPCHSVHDDAQVKAFLDIGHVNPGHTLVVVKPHVETMMDLDEDLASAAFRVANRVAKALQRAYAPAGMTILQANRPAGWQTVPHFHLHVLPRQPEDGVGLTWPAKNPAQERLGEIAAEVRAALA